MSEQGRRARWGGCWLGAAVLCWQVLGVSATTAVAAPARPVACRGVARGSVAELVCRDAGLRGLGSGLSEVYQQALQRSEGPQVRLLRAEQQSWLKGLDACMRPFEGRMACVRQAYMRRTVGLQAAYRLVPRLGPVRFTCNGDPADELHLTFYATEPPSLVAERGTQSVLMLQTVSGSGARYEGRNELFWEHQGEATLRWGRDGHDGPDMRCRPSR